MLDIMLNQFPLMELEAFRETCLRNGVAPDGSTVTAVEDAAGGHEGAASRYASAGTSASTMEARPPNGLAISRTTSDRACSAELPWARVRQRTDFLWSVGKYWLGTGRRPGLCSRTPGAHGTSIPGSPRGRRR